MTEKEPKFDVEKARERIVKGKRKKWWRRLGSKESGFWYKDADGSKIEDEKQLSRIENLVIPPAWEYVRITPSPRTNLQAVGMDTNGRVQYLYSENYRKKQERKKFEKIERFGGHLPNLRKVINEHIKLDGFPREKVLAVMMRLINSLYMRMGSDESVEKYRTYGITTLASKHLEIKENGELIFDFVGKHHIKQRKVLVDQELAEILQELVKIGRKRKLFEYLDENNKPQPIKPTHINQYIKNLTASEFSAKDFRTWGGTLLAALELSEIGCCDDENKIKENVVEAVKKVAEKLGNTPAVCRGSYIHPGIIESYESGITLEEFTPKDKRKIKKFVDMKPEEKALLKLFSNGKRGNNGKWKTENGK
ncbi:MAG: DNA topoisomerase IB [Acidobacteriota bacterium]|jgi:DNA topoisomerase-1|nr:DNA topoisomerase IB [Acidobacteriota bacterium]